MMSQSAVPAFLFYNPDPNPESRQHGRFIPQQFPLLTAQMRMLPVVAPLPSTPITRPGSSCSKPSTSVLMTPQSSTPVLSPLPIATKPAIVVDTDLSDAEGIYSPATPPLSSSSSVISSPGSCDMLQTPLNPMFSGLEGKESCDVDAELERFPSLDWSACASPPLTPGKQAVLDPFCFHVHFLAPGPSCISMSQPWCFRMILCGEPSCL
jgi:hypothetical protein